jgi:RNA-binding protein
MTGSRSRKPAGTSAKRKFVVKKQAAKEVIPRPEKPGRPPTSMTSAQRKHLRGLAHALKPLVLLGKEGINDGVVRSVQEALIDHELIKVKLLRSCPLAKDEAAVRIADEAGAALVQRIGKTCILYAPHPTHAVIQLPKA